MKSIAPEVAVMAGTVPPGHFPPLIAPLKEPADDCVILSVSVIVPDVGWVKVRAQVCALVSKIF